MNTYSNQSSTHKRKIESALAQSAINAIQNQTNTHNSFQLAATSTSVSTSGNNASNASKKNNSFLQFEQKAYSQPQNDITASQPAYAPTSNTSSGNNCYLVKSTDYHRRQTQPVHPPAFIMRNGGQNNSSNADYSNKVHHGGAQ